MKAIVCLGLIGAVVLTVGCQGGVWIGSDTLKSNMNSGTVTQYRNDAPNYEVLGTVSADTQATSVLGIVGTGTAGQGVLWERARLQYPEATGLKDISQKNDFINILWFIYTDVRTTYFATVVKEK